MNVAQKTSKVWLNGVSLFRTTPGILALKTVLLPARILGDCVWHGVWCCDTLLRHRLGRYPLSHRSAGRQCTQNIQPKTDMPHDFLLSLLFLGFLENYVGIYHGWLEEPPANVSPPLDWGPTHRVVGMVLIHPINAPHVGVVGDDGFRDGIIFCSPWCFSGDRTHFRLSIGTQHSNSSLVSPYCSHKIPIFAKVYFTFLHFLHLCFAKICWPAISVGTNCGACARVFFPCNLDASFTELKKVVVVQVVTFIQKAFSHFIDDMVSNPIWHGFLDMAQVHIILEHVPSPWISGTLHLYPPGVWFSFDILLKAKSAVKLDHCFVSQNFVARVVVVWFFLWRDPAMVWLWREDCSLGQSLVKPQSCPACESTGLFSDTCSCP